MNKIHECFFDCIVITDKNILWSNSVENVGNTQVDIFAKTARCRHNAIISSNKRKLSAMHTVVIINDKRNNTQLANNKDNCVNNKYNSIQQHKCVL